MKSFKNKISKICNHLFKNKYIVCQAIYPILMVKKKQKKEKKT